MVFLNSFHRSPSRQRSRRRRAKVLVILAVLLPTLCAFLGLAIDAALLMTAQRELQHAADAAAYSAAMEKQQGASYFAMVSAAVQSVQIDNSLVATVDLHNPPQSGPYAGSNQHVEVILHQDISLYIMPAVMGNNIRTVSARSVCGPQASTAGAAIVILDPNPAPLSVAAVPLVLPSLPSLVGGLEVLGAGKVDVDGAVLVNTRWGGLDENGESTGDSPPPPSAVACTPLLPLTKLRARDLRVVGGVDNPANYGNFVSGEPSPLRAGRLSVPDPLKSLPIPTLAADAANVKDTVYGGKTIVGLPLIGPPTTLHPGIYDWITVTSGKVVFEPGVYIIRGKDPLTQISLSILAGEIQASGVMFYLTNTSSFTPTTGSPDNLDSETQPPPPGALALVPSAVIDIGLINSSYAPLDAPSSPFHGMLIYQRRQDRRPVVLVQNNIILGGNVQGTIYAKWGHVILSGKGSYKTRVVSGTMRFITLLDCEVSPPTLLPPATDIFLVE